MTTAHPSANMLTAYADGTLSDGMSLLVACHLTYCPPCRAQVACLESLGGAMLEDQEPVRPGTGCLDRVLAQLDAPCPPDETADPLPRGASPLPCPLRRRLGIDTGLDDLTWRFMMPGASQVHLADFDDDETVGLIRARPGVGIPQHTHSGTEATLILTGEMRDGGSTFRRGDVALADEHDDHNPQVTGDQICLCLTVVSGSRRFTGPFGPILNMFAR